MSRAPKSSFEKILGKQRNIDRSLPFWRVWYKIRASWRHMRVSKLATRLLGRQYQRSRDMIEIDITYLCNLHCLNCNRSVSQARESLHMPVSTITQFVEDSISRGKEWRRIRILGGGNQHSIQISTRLSKNYNFMARCTLIALLKL